MFTYQEPTNDIPGYDRPPAGMNYFRSNVGAFDGQTQPELKGKLNARRDETGRYVTEILGQRVIVGLNPWEFNRNEKRTIEFLIALEKAIKDSPDVSSLMSSVKQFTEDKTRSDQDFYIAIGS